MNNHSLHRVSSEKSFKLGKSQVNWSSGIVFLVHSILFFSQGKIKRYVISFMLSDFLVDDSPHLKEDIDGLSTSSNSLQENTAPSEQPLPYIANSVGDVHDQHNESHLGELPLV